MKYWGWLLLFVYSTNVCAHECHANLVGNVGQYIHRPGRGSRSHRGRRFRSTLRTASNGTEHGADQGTNTKVLYTGGSDRLFTAGERSPNGLQPSELTPAEAALVLPGYWGHTKVFEYSYNVIPNNDRRYEVDCYCIQGPPCSCDRVNNNELYFYELKQVKTTKLSAYSVGRNAHYAINGSVELVETDPRNSASASHDTPGHSHLALIAAAVLI